MDFAPKKHRNTPQNYPKRPGENWMDVFLVFLGVLTTWILGPFGIEVVPWSRRDARDVSQMGKSMGKSPAKR